MWYYFLASQKYADFKGRATRTEFWYFVLFNSIFVYALMFIGMAFLGEESGQFPLIPNLAIGVRRMHNAGKSGWFLLLPIYNLILAVTDSDKGANKWGAPQNN